MADFGAPGQSGHAAGGFAYAASSAQINPAQFAHNTVRYYTYTLLGRVPPTIAQAFLGELGGEEVNALLYGVDTSDYLIEYAADLLGVGELVA